MSKKYDGKNVSVEWKFDLNKTLRENFSNRQWSDLVNKIVVDKIKPLIASGLSPVEGERMFQKYKNPEKYPGKLKASNKPNLKLSGEMLYNYVAKPGDEDMTVTIGIHKDSGEDVLTRAKANNEGTQGSAQTKIASSTKDRKLKAQIKAASKGIPARPFIPVKGKSYTRAIVLEIRKALGIVLSNAIKKGKQK